MSSTRLLAAVHPRAGGERHDALAFADGVVGSSPRGRGTQLNVRRFRLLARFIPARAGNAVAAAAGRSSRTVHPRAGGERFAPIQIASAQTGSSPRGRGTQLDAVRRDEGLRFIPARAGNAPACSASGPSASVHPRAGGERLSARPSLTSALGFIPARAGNAAPDPAACPIPPVHPRAGGERSRWSNTSGPPAGSSPRGRGTRARRRRRPRPRRFIPARAGNATAWAGTTTRSPVHPARAGNAGRRWADASRSAVHPRAGGERRVTNGPVVSAPGSSRAGGERRASWSIGRCRTGSSPRGRGTLTILVEDGPVPRFIPARAGNAGTRPVRACSRPVHPRAGGERVGGFILQPQRIGSSPRGRGTLRQQAGDFEAQRFIPARAGNACGRAPRRWAVTVHPRAGGERSSSPPKASAAPGSSPRGRGTRTAALMKWSIRRFIPARAGNASPSASDRWRRTVHPRAGGERRSRGGGSSIRHFGSSPRGRGTPPGQPLDEVARRFIPARAGNASLTPRATTRAPVHPRAGGERWEAPRSAGSRAGSSPRGRGTPARGGTRRPLRRFIPARGSSPRGRGTRA